MSSIDTSTAEGGASKKHRGVKMAKRLSTRIDMTPMVDLGFLLITFFIFTASMSRPTALDLAVPKDATKPTDLTDVAESGVMTILLDKNNSVYYYERKLQVINGASNMQRSDFINIRNVIIRKKAEVIANHKHDKFCPPIQDAARRHKEEDWSDACIDKDFVVIIKPGRESTYKNTVDILDETTICGVKTFALVKIEDVEVQLIGQHSLNYKNNK